MNDWSVYILRDESNSLYTGISTDVERRFREHAAGGVRSARYTRSRKQLQMVYSCMIGSRSLASKIEYRLKRSEKSVKESIVKSNCSAKDLLERLDLRDEAIS
jgi:putative endonuclease